MDKEEALDIPTVDESETGGTQRKISNRFVDANVLVFRSRKIIERSRVL
jgi:hypothetical protein